jgi:hypothetical protein
LKPHRSATAIRFLVDPFKLIVGTLRQVEERELASEGGALVGEVVDGYD